MWTRLYEIIGGFSKQKVVIGRILVKGFLESGTWILLPKTQT